MSNQTNKALFISGKGEDKAPLNPSKVIKEIDTSKNDSKKDFSKAKTTTAKRMSVTLPPDVASLLEDLATSQGISQNEALRKAIVTESYFYKERNLGTKILLKTKEEVREVLFR